jgi:NitT/TauT family transport system ATP-binding protein
MSTPAPLPDYLRQSPEVAARFAKLKARPVVMEIDRLGRQFSGEHGPVTALRDISLKIHRRELVCVIGPSGCGKSTLIRIIAGLDEPSSGRMFVDGKETSGPSPERGMVFQGYTLFPWRTVKQNVLFGLEMAGRAASEAEADARQWIDLVGLRHFADHYPHQLSGGMKQRVAIARALAPNPPERRCCWPTGSSCSKPTPEKSRRSSRCRCRAPAALSSSSRPNSRPPGATSTS